MVSFAAALRGCREEVFWNSAADTYYTRKAASTIHLQKAHGAVDMRSSLH